MGDRGVLKKLIKPVLVNTGNGRWGKEVFTG